MIARSAALLAAAAVLSCGRAQSPAAPSGLAGPDFDVSSELATSNGLFEGPDLDLLSGSATENSLFAEPDVGFASASAIFTISLPIRSSDSATNAFGLVPFGVHIGDHGLDGHPGWDFEYMPGSNVYAAAAGTVQSVLPSGNGTGFGIQITHVVNGKNYRTIYGVRKTAAGVRKGARIVAGQTLGPVDVFTRTIGTITVTYGFVHFQVDDFSSVNGLTNPNAVPPERFLDAASEQAADTIWRRARYRQEPVEPFLNNDRNATFPLRRTWTIEQGRLAPAIEFTRASAFANEFGYVLKNARGTVLERGTAEVEALAKPLATIDLRASSGGSPRRGVYNIVGQTMKIEYAAPGGRRPADLSGASVYKTK